MHSGEHNALQRIEPGEQGFITYRAFGTFDELERARVSGFTVASQAANCDEFDDVVGPAVAVQAQEWRGAASVALEVKGKPKGSVEGARDLAMAGASIDGSR